MPFNLSSPSRRNFLKLGSLASLGTLSVPLWAGPQEKAVGSLPSDLVLVFQGDSITDAGRNRGRYYANDTYGMGNGYVYQVVAEILARNPGQKIRCYNRGISGNKVHQLAKRWEEDCLQLKPQVLSLLIGVNDYWHTLSHNYKGTPEIFDQDLRALLDRTKTQYPQLKVILGEPFAVKGGTALTPAWKDDFPVYQEMVRNIAQDLNASFVPYQQVFDDALKLAPADYWCPDGVHPSAAGCYLMKDAWIKVFNQLW